MDPRAIACLVGLAAASLTLAANPEATERARARDCVNWTIELDGLAPKIKAAELTERVAKKRAMTSQGAQLRSELRPGTEAERLARKYEEAQRNLEALKARHKELETKEAWNAGLILSLGALKGQ